MPTDLKRLSRRIKAARAKANLTQAELGERAGVGASTVTRLENCKTNANITNINRITAAVREIERDKPPVRRRRQQRLSSGPRAQPTLAKPDSPNLITEVLCSGELGAVTVDELNFMAYVSRSGDINSAWELELEVRLRRVRVNARKAATSPEAKGEFEWVCDQLRGVMYVLPGQKKPAD